VFKNQRTYGIVFIAVASLCFFQLAQPTSFNINEPLSATFQNFPLQINAWHGEDTEVDERTLEILETRNVLSRVYKNNEGQSIHLLIVASKKDRRVAHPPEVCYVSSNYQIIEEKEIHREIDGRQISMKTFVAKNERNPKDVQQVVYLYKIGNKLTTNYYAQQLQFAWDQLSRKESEVLMIRLSGIQKELMFHFLNGVLTALEDQQ